MEISMPEWIDQDIVFHPVTWLFFVGGLLAFAIGFKGADGGLFGLVTSSSDLATTQGMGWPIWQKAMIVLAWPVVVYFFMGWKMNR